MELGHSILTRILGLNITLHVLSTEEEQCPKQASRTTNEVSAPRTFSASTQLWSWRWRSQSENAIFEQNSRSTEDQQWPFLPCILPRNRPPSRIYRRKGLVLPWWAHHYYYLLLRSGFNVALDHVESTSISGVQRITDGKRRQCSWVYAIANCTPSLGKHRLHLLDTIAGDVASG